MRGVGAIKHNKPLEGKGRGKEGRGGRRGGMREGRKDGGGKGGRGEREGGGKEGGEKGGRGRGREGKGREGKREGGGKEGKGREGEREGGGGETRAVHVKWNNSTSSGTLTAGSPPSQNSMLLYGQILKLLNELEEPNPDNVQVYLPIFCCITLQNFRLGITIVNKLIWLVCG